MQNHHQKRWRANEMYITLNRIQKLDCRRTCEMNVSGPFHIFTAGHCRTDCMRWTMAAVRIYACYFPVIFLALFTSASILVNFSRLYKVFHLEEATLRVHQGSFSRLKRKLFLLRLVCLWAQHEYLCFLSPLNWHKRPYGCWTKSWTNFFIFKIQMEAALSWMPEWKNGQGTWSKEGF